MSPTTEELLRNRWVQLGLAIAAGYVLGRVRKPVHLGAFGRTIATTAFTALVRQGIQFARTHQFQPSHARN